MALMHTPPPEIGENCPEFRLRGVDGKIYERQNFAQAKALVVMFICNHCPYVQSVEDRILTLAREMQPQNVAFVGICANDAINYPEDSFENLKSRAEKKNYPFPYLHDETQEVAKAFGAVCTPDFFVYDSHHKLAYRGRLDDSWKDPTRVQKQELKEALLAIIRGENPLSQQNPSMGCSIKWR